MTESDRRRWFCKRSRHRKRKRPVALSQGRQPLTKAPQEESSQTATADQQQLVTRAAFIAPIMVAARQSVSCPR